MPPGRNIESLSPLGLLTWNLKVKANDGHTQVFTLFFGEVGVGGDGMEVRWGCFGENSRERKIPSSKQTPGQPATSSAYTALRPLLPSSPRDDTRQRYAILPTCFSKPLNLLPKHWPFVSPRPTPWQSAGQGLFSWQGIPPLSSHHTYARVESTALWPTSDILALLGSHFWMA